MNQGNFLTQYQIDIYDCNEKRKYKGNIFLFEFSIVCTERLSPTNHQFKSYFPYQTGHMECISENKFVLSESDNYKMEITGESTKAIQSMMQQIRVMLNELPFNEINRYSSSSADSLNMRISSINSDHSSAADSMFKSLLVNTDNNVCYFQTGGVFDVNCRRSFIE